MNPHIAEVAGVNVDTRHWIGGQRVASAQTFADISPIDETEIAQVSLGTATDVDAAVAAARAAFAEFRPEVVLLDYELPDGTALDLLPYLGRAQMIAGSRKALYVLRGLDIAGEAAPFLREVLLAHLAPRAIARRGWEALLGGVQMLAGLPQDLGRLIRAARRGKLQLEVDVPALKSFGDQLDRAASRLTMAIVTAALIVGSSIVMTVDRGGGVATLGLLGFIAAMLGGLGSALGPLAAGVIIGVSEAVTMAVASPSWAPIVSFSLLIAMLLFRPGKTT